MDIAEAEAYFKELDKTFYNRGIEMLGRHWNDVITLEGQYVDEFCQKIVILYVSLGTFRNTLLYGKVLNSRSAANTSSFDPNRFSSKHFFELGNK